MTREGTRSATPWMRARALGASTPRILFFRILPNIVALAIIIASTLLGFAILAEAGRGRLAVGRDRAP